MAPTTPRPARRKVRKVQTRSRRSRVDKRSPLRSPRTLVAYKKPRTRAKRKAIAKPGGARGFLAAIVNNKAKPSNTNVSPRIVKYNLATQWPSSEPFEKNCLQREPLPDDYVFVPSGNVYVTKNCRSKTKESHRIVYKVYDNAGKKVIGIRVPSDVHTAVLQAAEETAESRAHAVKVRDEKELARSRQILCLRFPLMPVEDLEAVLDHAFLKGSGRVGRTSTISDEHKAVLAVEAHIRHLHTPYESLLRAGAKREEARKAVWDTVSEIFLKLCGRAPTSPALRVTPPIPVAMDISDLIEPPQKRLKTEDASDKADAVLPATVAAAPQPDADEQMLREIEVGITEFVSAENEGFAGVLKKRYTDFLVNEILPSGKVLHLQSTAVPGEDVATNSPATEEKPEEEKPNEPKTPAEEPPAPAELQLSGEDRSLLESFFGEQYVEKILSLHRKAMANLKTKPSDLGRLSTVVVNDRDQRIQIHQAIRRIFSSQLESSTDSDGTMIISASSTRNKRGNQNTGQGGRGGGGRDRVRVNWDELGGPYLHFTIYKENKDTMEVIGFIARQLKMNPKSLQFAGTKDRRGVTVQRACVHRVHADRLAKLNRTLRNAVVGDFEYRRHGLELGDLNGNEFVVTLRDCEIPGVDTQDREAAVAKAKELATTALKNLHQRGYFNYYGLQRFGSFTTRTDMIGLKILQDDFKGACDSILDYSPHVLAAAQAGEASTVNISSEDKARALAIHIFRTTGQVSEALEKMPRKFSAETNIIRHLGRSKNDHLGALQTIPRNLRLMYVHAYQSLVWNLAVGERWRLHGDRVVEGDLVLVHEHHDKDGSSATVTSTEAGAGAGTGEVTVDADGEIIIAPQEGDSAYAAEDTFIRARALTADEATSGKYTIFDIVLPLPGFDVIYPADTKMTDFYKTFMGSARGGGLDPFNMRRKWKDASLSGSYRKILSRMGPDLSVDVKLYSRDDEQFVQTDLEALSSKPKDEVKEESGTADAADKIALILKFQLGSSQYATMALRELMKGRIKAYQPDFGGGR
ncbi:pseudouridine synthase [Aspergillus granulosus]|uniref:Pseudouridine synthase n=1 Tax=Aspergillus granulosus TaxID=176169 RepID=A0ABR4HEZ3_9EURO